MATVMLGVSWKPLIDNYMLNFYNPKLHLKLIAYKAKMPQCYQHNKTNLIVFIEKDKILNSEQNCNNGT